MRLNATAPFLDLYSLEQIPPVNCTNSTRLFFLKGLK